MIPFTPESAARLGRRGGLRMTAARRASLRALHASRRGRRKSAPSAEREDTLERVRRLLENPARGVRSIRAVARSVGVSDRAVRRWLAGEDWPGMRYVRAMREWVAAQSW